jgi:hypothetical protein
MMCRQPPAHRHPLCHGNNGQHGDANAGRRSMFTPSAWDPPAASGAIKPALMGDSSGQDTPDRTIRHGARAVRQPHAELNARREQLRQPAPRFRIRPRRGRSHERAPVPAIVSRPSPQPISERPASLVVASRSARIVLLDVTPLGVGRLLFSSRTTGAAVLLPSRRHPPGPSTVPSRAGLPSAAFALGMVDVDYEPGPPGTWPNDRARSRHAAQSRHGSDGVATPPRTRRSFFAAPRVPSTAPRFPR